MIQRYVQFWFLEKSLGLISPSHFVYIILRKYFLNLYSIKWPNFIIWLPVRLEILGNMCTVIIWFPVGGIINFETSLSLLIWFFSFMTNLNIVRKKKFLRWIWKYFFIFKRFSAARGYLRSEGGPIKVDIVKKRILWLIIYSRMFYLFIFF